MTAQTDANCLKIAGFGNNGDSAAAPGGGLLIDFLIKPRSMSWRVIFVTLAGASWLCSAI